ncbi:MAG TPA: hypothetical protein VJK71_04340 [Gemmatimonadales bacterium]|nr:hypothetical protein [Gemmatimonadales bacterium]
MTWPTQHLTAEDLDAFHSASLTREAAQHLEDCSQCHALVHQDRALLQALESLPVFAPRADFADRVLARVHRPAPLTVRIRKPRSVALAALILIGLGASAGWSIINRALLASWIDATAMEIGRSIWIGFATLAQNLSEQPWVSGLLQVGSSTPALVALGSALLIGYPAAMMALRRLLVLPRSTGSNASW